MHFYNILTVGQLSRKLSHFIYICETTFSPELSHFIYICETTFSPELSHFIYICETTLSRELSHIYIWVSFRENEPSLYIYKSYKNHSRLNRYNFRTVHAIDFLFSPLHTTPFFYGKILFEVLHGATVYRMQPCILHPY